VVIASSKLFILDSSSRNDVVISALNVIAVFCKSWSAVNLT
jgi:hypothetical protein